MITRQKLFAIGIFCRVQIMQATFDRSLSCYWEFRGCCCMVAVSGYFEARHSAVDEFLGEVVGSGDLWEVVWVHLLRVIWHFEFGFVLAISRVCNKPLLSVSIRTIFWQISAVPLKYSLGAVLQANLGIRMMKLRRSYCTIVHSMHVDTDDWVLNYKLAIRVFLLAILWNIHDVLNIFGLSRILGTLIAG